MDTTPLVGPPSPSMTAVLNESGGGEGGSGSAGDCIDFAAQLVAATQPSADGTSNLAIPRTGLRAEPNLEGLLGWILATPTVDEDEDGELAPSESDPEAAEDAAVMVQAALVIPPLRLITGETPEAVSVPTIGPADTGIDALGPVQEGARETGTDALGNTQVGAREAGDGATPDSGKAAAAPEHARPLIDGLHGPPALARQIDASAAEPPAGERGRLDAHDAVTAVDRRDQPLVTGGEVADDLSAATVSPSAGSERGPVSDERPSHERQFPTSRTPGIEAVTALNQSAASVPTITPASDPSRDLTQRVHRPIIGQVVEGILRASQRPGHSVRLTLHPEGLGAVSLTVGLAGHQVDIRIAVDNPATRELLQANMAALSRALTEQGLSVSGAQVELMGGHTGPDGSAQQFAWTAPPASRLPGIERETDDDPVSQVGTLTWGTRVDYRV